jgi:hypothetical protein
MYSAVSSGRAVLMDIPEEIGNPASRAEEINVLIVEGDQNQGIGVVMSEPVIIEPKQRGVVCGDLAEWVPGPGKIGRITQVVTPDFEMGL